MYYESRLEQKFDEPDSVRHLAREGEPEVDQSPIVRTRRRTQNTQDAARLPAQREPIAQPDIFSEEFDDIWPSQASSTVRRYRSDVQSVHGRSHMQRDTQTDTHADTHADAHEPGYGEPHLSPSSNQSRQQHAIPPRRSARNPTHSSAGAIDSAEVAAAIEIARGNVETEEERQPTTLRPQGTRSEVHTEDSIIIPEFHRLRKQRRDGQRQWLPVMVAAIVVMVLGWCIVNAVLGWWQITQDDLRYGRPRTYQTDQVVGHNDSVAHPSHFIAINLNRHVEVIEFPGGDASHARVYMGPILVGNGQDLAPVTLTFKDLNNDRRPDMIINVQDSHFVFINDPDQFRAPRPGELDLH